LQFSKEGKFTNFKDYIFEELITKKNYSDDKKVFLKQPPASDFESEESSYSAHHKRSERKEGYFVTESLEEGVMSDLN
jgi:hypothetical protein